MAKNRVTVLGTGEIAEKMAKTLKLMGDQVTMYGVISRDLNRAREFADVYGFEHAFDSKEAVLADGQTELVYVASPHHMHLEHAKYFLENKIPVLCEKPMTVNSKQLMELLKVSKDYQTTLVDATWMRYMPFIDQVKKLAKKHKLGELKNIQASLGIQKQHVQRMVDPDMAGGSLLDVGIYPVTFACAFNDSEVKKIHALAQMTELGVDQSTVMMIEFEDGMFASLQSSMGSILNDKQTLSYEQGRIECVGMPNVELIRVYDHDNLLEEVTVEKQLTGYEYEVLEAFDAIKNKKIEPKTLSHRESLKVIRILDEVRSQIGLVYPFEK